MANLKTRKILEKGEGIDIEFKECKDELPNSIYETVCAFLNRNGGDILLGVKDNKEIQGIKKDKIEQIKKRLCNNNKQFRKNVSSCLSFNKSSRNK